LCEMRHAAMCTVCAFATGSGCSATLPPPPRRWTRPMKILLARHGETQWNAEGRYQGQEDIALSPVGEAQARALGERLREVRIDRAVASPLSRARSTAG